MIGFIDEPYVAFENDGNAIVTFGVINGTLQREVAVNLSFTGASAIGELTFLTQLHYYVWTGFPS